jgi:tetratricopeptide (TPR) repeat protein
MFTPTVRIVLAIVALWLMWTFWRSGNMTSFGMIAFSLVLIVWGYFKNGTVYNAFQKLKKDDFEGAELALAKTPNPQYLKKSHKSYYHFTKGMIELNRDNFDLAYDELNSALSIGLRTDNDSALVYLNLASLELQRKRYKEAGEFLKKSKNLEHKPLLDPEIEKIEKEINECTTTANTL